MALLPNVLRARVHCPDVAARAEDARGRAPLHRAGLALGERLSRIVQRQDAGPVSQWRAVLDAPRSADSDGTLADPRPYRPSAQESRGPATRSRSPPACELKAHMVGGTNTPGWSMGPLHAGRPP